MKLTVMQHQELNRIAEKELAVATLLTGSVERSWLQAHGLIAIDVRPGVGRYWIPTLLGKKLAKKHTVIGEGEV